MCSSDLVTDLLALRKNHPKLFECGSYEPVFAEGPAADRVCAFLRRYQGDALLVAGLVYPARGMKGVSKTTIRLPEDMANLPWRSCFAEGPMSPAKTSATALFRILPTAVLIATHG